MTETWRLAEVNHLLGGKKRLTLCKSRRLFPFFPQKLVLQWQTVNVEHYFESIQKGCEWNAQQLLSHFMLSAWMSVWRKHRSQRPDRSSASRHTLLLKDVDASQRTEVPGTGRPEGGRWRSLFKSPVGWSPTENCTRCRSDKQKQSTLCSNSVR